MTSATIRPESGAGGRHAEARRYGLIFFASILLLVVALYGLCAYGSRENLAGL